MSKVNSVVQPSRSTLPADDAFRSEAQKVAQMPFPQPIIGAPIPLPRMAPRNPVGCAATVGYGAAILHSTKKGQQAIDSYNAGARHHDTARISPDTAPQFSSFTREMGRGSIRQAQQQMRESIGAGAGAGAVGILGNPDPRHCIPAPNPAHQNLYAPMPPRR